MLMCWVTYPLDVMLILGQLMNFFCLAFFSALLPPVMTATLTIDDADD